MARSVELSLQSRVAVVTGAARGRGAVYGGGFLDEGAKVAATDRSWAGAEAFQRELEGRGALCVEMDVTDDAQMDRAVQRTREQGLGGADRWLDRSFS